MWQTLAILGFILFGWLMYDYGKKSIKAELNEKELDDIRRADDIIDNAGYIYDQLFNKSRKQ